MGLHAQFKPFVRERLSDAVLASEPPAADVYMLDAPCILHAFRARDEDQPVALQLVDALVRGATRGAPARAVVIVCFDRYADTPTAKARAHKKRRQAERVWTRDDVLQFLEVDDLPRGDGWGDLLATRDVREVLFEYLHDRLVQWYLDGGWTKVSRFIVHNGSAHGGPTVCQDRRVVPAPPDAPEAGEADVVMAAWAARVARENPAARVIVRTVDSDLCTLLCIHGTDTTVLSLSHHEDKHRLCVSIGDLRGILHDEYGLTPREFVTIAILRGTDFVAASLTRMKPWSEFVQRCADLFRSEGPIVIDDHDGRSSVDMRALYRVLDRLGDDAKMKKSPVRGDSEHREALEFNFKYWFHLEYTRV